MSLEHAGLSAWQLVVLLYCRHMTHSFCNQVPLSDLQRDVTRRLALGLVERERHCLELMRTVYDHDTRAIQASLHHSIDQVEKAEADLQKAKEAVDKAKAAGPALHKKRDIVDEVVAHVSFHSVCCSLLPSMKYCNQSPEAGSCKDEGAKRVAYEHAKTLFQTAA